MKYLTDECVLSRCFKNKDDGGDPETSFMKASALRDARDNPLLRMFRRNLRGMVTHESQYGHIYRDLIVRIPSVVADEIGHARTDELLYKQAMRELRPYAQKAPIAVWRTLPETAVDNNGDRLLYCRMHMMTEEMYAAYAQEEEA